MLQHIFDTGVVPWWAFLGALVFAAVAGALVALICFWVMDQTRIRSLRWSSLLKYLTVGVLVLAVGVSRAAAPAFLVFGIGSLLDALLELTFRGEQYVPAVVLAIGVFGIWLAQLSAYSHAAKVQDYVRAAPSGADWPTMALAKGATYLVVEAVRRDREDRSVVSPYYRRLGKRLTDALPLAAPEVLRDQYKEWRRDNPPPLTSADSARFNNAATSSTPNASTLAVIALILSNGGNGFLSPKRFQQIIEQHT